MRQAYDYWQDQPGSIPHRRRRRTRSTSPGDVTPRGDDGSRSMRTINAEFGQTEVEDLLPRWCSASESSGCSSWAEMRRISQRLGARTRLRGSPHAAPLRGQRWENVQRCGIRIPSGRYAIQETRRRPRLSLLHRRLKRLARADVTAPAGIRPTQTSQPLPTRLHELHLLSDHAAHQQPKPSHRRQLESPNHAMLGT